MPETLQNLYTVYNFCDSYEIQQMAMQNPVTYQSKTFVTVARLSKEKGLLRCIPIFEQLKKDGFDFEWHIVGGGPLKEQIQCEITRCSLEENIILEGEQVNPYRFMKNADYFLLPSFHEAAPMVFDEALALNIPVLTTNTLSAMELVGKRGSGLVCENTDQSIYDMLYRVMSNDIKVDIAMKPNNKVCMEQFNHLCKP